MIVVESNENDLGRAMFEGTVVNGVVVLDGGPHLPEGARVWVDCENEFEVGPPAPSETYSEHLAILRRSIAEAEAGIPGIPLIEARNRIVAEFNLPAVTGE